MVILGEAQRRKVGRRGRQGKGCHNLFFLPLFFPQQMTPLPKLYTQTWNAAEIRCPMCTSQGRDNVMIYSYVVLVICLFSCSCSQQQGNYLRVENNSYIFELIWTLHPDLMGSKALETVLTLNLSYTTTNCVALGKLFKFSFLIHQWLFSGLNKMTYETAQYYSRHFHSYA